MNGLRRHEAQKHKEYNTPPVSISSLEVPEFLLRQFKQEIISGFWSCYKNNSSGRGWKKFVLVCHEAVFVQIFRSYTRVLIGSIDVFLNECLGSEEWAIKYTKLFSQIYVYDQKMEEM